MNKETFDWNKHLKEALDRTEFMAISTLGSNGTWTCPVQFSYDKNINLYFKSMPNSRHMENLSKNPNISVAIFNTNRINDNVIGIQLSGNAEILKSKESVEEAAKHHYERNNSGIDYMEKIDEHLGEEAVWNFVKIIPDEIWLFDTRYFDEETEGRQRVPEEIFKK